VFAAIRTGRLVDDGELAVAMHPLSGRALTVPLVDVRRLLRIAVDRGLPRDVAAELLASARDVHYADRTSESLATAWRDADARTGVLVDDVRRGTSWSIKQVDASLAVDYVLRRKRDPRAAPEDLRRVVEDVLLWE
jgi:hypothetical protein